MAVVITLGVAHGVAVLVYVIGLISMNASLILAVMNARQKYGVAYPTMYAPAGKRGTCRDDGLFMSP